MTTTKRQTKNKHAEPSHVVMRSKDIFCRHCGMSRSLYPDSGPGFEDGFIALTKRSIRAMELLVKDFQEHHAKCIETASSPSRRAGESIDRWLASGDTGISSETIAHVMTGRGVGACNFGYAPPRDPSDFGRCHRLLKLFPTFQTRMHEVSTRFPDWKPLVDHWEELTALYEEEEPSGNAPKLYARMKELRGET